MSLRKKIAHGALWSLVENIGNQGISFVVFMFVARLIGPAEYGLASICFVAFSLANLVIFGLADGIISLRIKDDRRLNSLFWFLMGIGIVSVFLCLAGAKYIAAFMGEPRLTPLLQWFSIVFISLASSVIPTRIIFVNLDFKAYALRSLYSSLLSGVVGVWMAARGYGAFAIVAQQIVLYTMMSIIAWHFVEWRPSFMFDFASLKESLKPGYKYIVAGIVGFSEEQLPRLFIGSVLGPHALGLYALATRLRFAFQNMFMDSILSVLYPSLTQILEDRDEQKQIMEKALGVVGLLIFPGLALAIYLAPLYVPLLFGEVWKDAIPILQLFIFGSAVYSIPAIVQEALHAHNRLGSFIKIRVPVVSVSLALIAVFLTHGLVAIATALTIWMWISVVVYLYFFHRWIGINLLGAVTQLSKPLISVTAMIVGLYLYHQSSFYPSNDWLDLILSMALGGSLYLGSCCLVQFHEMVKILSFVKQIRSSPPHMQETPY